MSNTGFKANIAASKSSNNAFAKPADKLSKVSSLTLAKLPSMKDCWKMDIKDKINSKSLELFVQETDSFIKQMNNDLKSECKSVGIKYVDPNQDNQVKIDLVKDLELTRKLSIDYNVTWPKQFDLNVFAKVVSQCNYS